MVDGIPQATSNIMQAGKRTAEKDDKMDSVKSKARLEHLNGAPNVEVVRHLRTVFAFSGGEGCEDDGHAGQIFL